MKKIGADGFTYVDILVAIGILFIFIEIFVQLNQYNVKLRQKSDEINKMSMAAQGVMDVYRELGRDLALTYNEGYAVGITEEIVVGHTKLSKVKVTVSPKISGLSNITLISYYN